MDAKKVASEILSKVGQKENVVSNATCMTRLRLTVADTSKVDVAGLKDVDSVLGVVEREQGVQIVLGPGVVNKVGNEFSKLTNIPLGFEDVNELAKEKLFPSNKDEVTGLLETLGICGILEAKEHRGFWDSFTPMFERDSGDLRQYFSYPFHWWKGKDRVNYENVKNIFKIKV